VASGDKLRVGGDALGPVGGGQRQWAAAASPGRQRHVRAEGGAEGSDWR
jgi:hypothetical protein